MPYITANCSVLPKIGESVDGTIDGKPARICLISDMMLKVEGGQLYAINTVAYENGKVTFGAIGATRPLNANRHAEFQQPKV